MIASLPAKEGFGFEHPPLPSIAGPSKKPSPSVASSSKDRDAGKGKRRKTPEYTDSEDESSYESMDEDAVKELLRPAKKHLVSHQTNFITCHHMSNLMMGYRFAEKA